MEQLSDQSAIRRGGAYLSEDNKQRSFKNKMKLTNVNKQTL